MLRGNVDTRIARMTAGDFDAILLAYSGLRRLGLGERATSLIDPREAPPAPGQGALAIEVREADRDQPWLAALRHPLTTVIVAAERGALAALEGNCRTPIGAHAWAGGRGSETSGGGAFTGWPPTLPPNRRDRAGRTCRSGSPRPRPRPFTGRGDQGGGW